MNIDAKALPRMSSVADAGLVESRAKALPPDSTIIEFGPWLGAFSAILSQYGTLHVVDTFEWTKAHDQREPGILKPGESFMPVLQSVLAELGLEATMHQSLFKEFHWGGGPIDLVVVDGPKSAADLRHCLSAVAPSLNPDATLLIKHVFDPRQAQMAAYVAALVESNVLRVGTCPSSGGNTVIVLHPGPEIAQFSAIQEEGTPHVCLRKFAAKLDLDEGHPFFLTPTIAALLDGNWRRVYENIQWLEPNVDLLGWWDKIEPFLLKKNVDATALADLREVLTAHLDTPVSVELPVAFNKTADLLLRGFWINNRENPELPGMFHPSLLRRFFEFGYANWPNKVRKIVRGQDILDVGGGPGLHGLGYIAAGAKSYLGIDPIVKTDRDRVKNLTAKTKDKFGWTPAEISKMIAPWHASPQAIEDLPDDARFDLATLHNVTEHLHQIADIFREIAARLRPDGKILYNHHNFYCWNGHHLRPKVIADIDPSDPAQNELLDWGHIEYQPEPDHYIARGLNKIRLDDLIELTERYFTIELMEEIPSKPATGLGRLTAEIQDRYPYLQKRDFETQNLFCIARVKN